jgi:hypothetical protein
MIKAMDDARTAEVKHLFVAIFLFVPNTCILSSIAKKS